MYIWQQKKKKKKKSIKHDLLLIHLFIISFQMEKKNGSTRQTTELYIVKRERHIQWNERKRFICMNSLNSFSICTKKQTFHNIKKIFQFHYIIGFFFRRRLVFMWSNSWIFDFRSDTNSIDLTRKFLKKVATMNFFFFKNFIKMNSAYLLYF